MIFTACALIAKRYWATPVKGMDYKIFHTSIHSTIANFTLKILKRTPNLTLLDAYSSIRMNITDNQGAINNFIDNAGKNIRQDKF